MIADEFRQLALALPGAGEGAHMGHPDFRVGGKVFATLAADGSWAMVKLSPAGQAACTSAQPQAFEPFAGAWGRQGCTRIHLAAAGKASVRALVREAWRHVAPRRLLEQLDELEG